MFSDTDGSQLLVGVVLAGIGDDGVNVDEEEDGEVAWKSGLLEIDGCMVDGR